MQNFLILKISHIISHIMCSIHSGIPFKMCSVGPSSDIITIQNCKLIVVKNALKNPAIFLPDSLKNPIVFFPDSLKNPPVFLAILPIACPTPLKNPDMLAPTRENQEPTWYQEPTCLGIALTTFSTCLVVDFTTFLASVHIDCFDVPPPVVAFDCNSKSFLA